MQSKRLLQIKKLQKELSDHELFFLLQEAEVESCCVRRSNKVKLKGELLLEILRLTNCIYEARALGFRPPGANAN